MTESGYEVRVHSSVQSSPNIKVELPDVDVISLDRLPSHWRPVAEWFWEAKSRRYIPMVLEGGKPEKMAVVRERFPEARFCETGQAANVLACLLATDEE